MRHLLAGTVAGAAGTIALDVAGYADMALRGRPSSDVPAEVVRRIAEKAGFQNLAKPDESVNDATKNRRSGLGALTGYSVGLFLGAAYGLARPYVKSLPAPIVAVGLAFTAMAMSDVPATRLGATDPTKWSAMDWISDVIPHLFYGFTTVFVADAIECDD